MKKRNIIIIGLIASIIFIIFIYFIYRLSPPSIPETFSELKELWIKHPEKHTQIVEHMIHRDYFSSLSEDQIIDLLGEPYKYDEKNDEYIYGFEKDNHLLLFEYTRFLHLQYDDDGKVLKYRTGVIDTLGLLE